MNDHNVERFHRILVNAALIILPITFLLELAMEITDGDDSYWPLWYTYTPFLVIAVWQSRRDRPNALWLILPAMAFVPLAAMYEWIAGVNIGGLDSATALMILLLLGMVSALVLEEWPTWATWAFTAVVGVTATVSGVNESLPANDLIIRTTSGMTAVALASLLAVRLRAGLLTAVAEQRELAESREQLIAAVSHELRTPLTAIAGLSDEIAGRGSDMEISELMDLAGVIAEQSDDMTHIIEDLLTAAQARAGNLSVNTRIVDLAHEVDKVAHSPALAALLENRKLRVQSADVSAVADPRRCRQIIRNLLTNAVRYGGQNIAVDIRLADTYVVATISDDGDGLTFDDSQRVFEPFFTADNASARPGSVGLGLAVSRQLAERMGGALVYVDTDNDATVFELRLPAAVDAPEPVSARPVPASI